MKIKTDAPRESATMKLRPYQEKGISDIRALFRQGRRKVCYAAPTGSGKTILFVHDDGDALTFLGNPMGEIAPTGAHRSDVQSARGRGVSLMAWSPPDTQKISTRQCRCAWRKR